MASQGQDIESLFHEARRIADLGERVKFVESACAGDGALRARVEKLLAAEAELGSFLRTDETVETPNPARGRSASNMTTIAGAPREYELPAERPGAVIGRYKLLQQIGEGGFGVVYMAEQREPVQRRVALKIIKLGMDTRQIIARFEAERQALALMDHPNIAKVLDAGATETGRPYFVMELVKGIPITEYCDKENMSFRDRLKLFIQVCGAVQHAHQKGIIHRDIKPSNVLVTHVDDKPVPKVIDFGIAKATQQKLTEHTMFTQFGQFMGTPAYMSPEQADPLGMDIDTRSDIYSLGVLLYELLTGATPFEMQTLRTAALDEIKRIIREQDPPRPSTRLSTLGDELPNIARRRGLAVKGIRSFLRGDLDWIILRAMEKDRTRRYESANELARDIERHLNQEPVAAGPPSAVYKMSKFVRRHRAGVAAGAVGVLTLIGFAVTMTVQANRIASERDRANFERQMSDRIVDFQADMLQKIVPRKLGESIAVDLRQRVDDGLAAGGAMEEQRATSLASFDALLAGANLTDAARGILDANILAPAVKTVEERFADQPLVEARLQFALADTYSALGLHEQALARARRSLELREKHLGPEHPDTLRAVNFETIALWELGRNEESRETLDRSIAVFARVFGPEDANTLRARMQRAILDSDRGLYSKAGKQYEELMAIQERVLGPDHYDLGLTLLNLGVAYNNQSYFDKAAQAAERSLAIIERTPESKEASGVTAMQTLAEAYQGLGRKEEAAELQLKVLRSVEKDRGARHPDTISAMHRLVDVYKDQGRLQEAEPLARKVLELRRTTPGSKPLDTAAALSTLGMTLALLGRHDEAEPLFIEAYEITKTDRGTHHKETLNRLNNLAVHYWYIGQLQKSLDTFSDYLVAMERAYGKDHLETTTAMANVALLYKKLGRIEESQAMVQRAMDIRVKAFGKNHPETMALISLQATTAYEIGENEKAASLLEEILPVQKKVHGIDHPLTLETVYNLAMVKIKLGLREESMALLTDNLERRRRVVGFGHNETLDAASELAGLWLEAGRKEEAHSLYADIVAARRSAATSSHPSAAELDACALVLLTCKMEDLRDPRAALDMARKANEATNYGEAGKLNTLARALFDTGAISEALETQRAAIGKLPAESRERAEYEERLASYTSGMSP